MTWRLIHCLTALNEPAPEFALDSEPEPELLLAPPNEPEPEPEYEPPTAPEPDLDPDPQLQHPPLAPPLNPADPPPVPERLSLNPYQHRKTRVRVKGTSLGSTQSPNPC